MRQQVDIRRKIGNDTLAKLLDSSDSESEWKKCSYKIVRNVFSNSCIVPYSLTIQVNYLPQVLIFQKSDSNLALISLLSEFKLNDLKIQINEMSSASAP